MKRRGLYIFAGCAALMLSGIGVMAAPPVPTAAARGTKAAVAAPAPVADAAAQKALVDRYCVTCHNQRTKAGSLTLDDKDLTKVTEKAEIFERVMRKLGAGMMPPPGQPHPDPAALKGFVSYLQTAIDRDAAAHPNPGRTETLHRLNRAEYSNAVRDVLLLDVDVEGLLPPDDASYGFDNIAGVLKLNQSNMERYLSAAMRVSRAAVGAAPSSPALQIFPVPVDLSQYERVDGLPFGTRGGTLIKYNFSRDGEYEIKASLTCTTEVDLECNGSLGFSEPHELQILVDGAVVKSFVLQPKYVDLQNPDEPTPDGQPNKEERWGIRLPIKAGPHAVGVTFVKGPEVEYVRQGYRKRFERPFRYYADTQFASMPFVDKVWVAGPFQSGSELGLAGDSPSRRAIFICTPTSAADEAPCARKIMARIARRAYRRPVTDADLTELMDFYAKGAKDGGFEPGVELALRRMLVSTNFLFRMEAQPATAKPGTNYRISDLELASRLSFFLWSSVPDDQLLDAALGGTLRQPAVLKHQVERMLADHRSYSLVENFFGQWLKLRHVDNLRPSEQLFPDFDASLRSAFRRETEMFADNMIRTDRSVMDMLTADYTFVNDRLARHYGIPNVGGSEFRKVTYPDDHRRGILGHGSILTLTSHPIRTSPVIRGKWVLENVLNVAPPPPPANVPPLKEDEQGARAVLTMRERMAKHRANPVCSSCHSTIDPAGFALENFDPTGKWRDHDDSFKAIDPSGVLPDGTKFSSLGEFRKALLDHPDRFVSNFTERLMIYALGRGSEYYDQPTLRAIVQKAGASDYKFSSVVLGIVNSLPFQMRRADEPASSMSASR